MYRSEQSSNSARFPRSEMRLRMKASLLSTLLLFGLLSQLAHAQQFTNRARFGIPFEFDQAELTRLGAVEIRLYLSTDDGENWQQSQSVAPDAGRFQFEAPNDGRYLFAVRTVDTQGRLHPARELSPELHVVVDQATPQITLTLVSTRAGEITALWQVQDANLDVDSIDLQYSVNGRDWNSIAGVDAAVGQIRFGDGLFGVVTVRMTAADRAGNPQVVTRELDLNSSEPANTDTDSNTPDFERPVAGIPGAQSEPTSPGGNPIIRPGSLRGHANPVMPSSIAIDEHQDVAEPAVNTRFVNALTFRIGYDVGDVDPSGIEDVEFYITEDDGAHWFHYGTDHDGSSPYEITVPQEGKYGFSMRVNDRNALSIPPPQPGEEPDSFIVVDRESPVVALHPPTQRIVEQQNKLFIEWSIRDDQLADRPVALFYSTSGQRQDWEPITGWMENSERYEWTVDRQFGKPIYIRLDARDAAGNITSVVAEDPIAFDRSRSQARITDVETVIP